ncbi:hypothetical protein OpiT1DRAFT_03141 [Opitutaceae bacterium TAV1]|nr:hypothetical protein OpiT1DRAFT_03141 [Opitutaceae bacterium TAV1]
MAGEPGKTLSNPACCLQKGQIAAIASGPLPFRPSRAFPFTFPNP